MMVLDKFFLKYEEEIILTPSPQERTTLKKPSLIRVNDYFCVQFSFVAFINFNIL